MQENGVPSRSPRQWSRALPQPFKALWLVAVVAILGAVVGVALSGSALVLLPAVLVLAAVGAVLALDVRSNATRLTELLRSGRWLGQDLSGSLLARPWYPRLVGAGVVVAAVVLGVMAVLDPSAAGG